MRAAGEAPPRSPSSARRNDVHDNEWFIVTAFMTTKTPGISSDFWNRMTSWWSTSDVIHVETYFGNRQHDDTWRITRTCPGGFYRGKQYRVSGWLSVRTDLTKKQYMALRRAFAQYNDYTFDTGALKWYPCFPSGCCAGGIGRTMCSHVVADVYSRAEVGILDRDDMLPFAKNTPRHIHDAMTEHPESRFGMLPPVERRTVAAVTHSSLLRAARSAKNNAHRAPRQGR